MSEYYADLRKMLRAVRLACGFTQKSVAAALGISRSAYTYYESGHTSPDIPTLKVLAAVFGLPAECFLYPEQFTQLETARKRAPKKVGQGISHIGLLSEEERALIARTRAAHTGR